MQCHYSLSPHFPFLSLLAIRKQGIFEVSHCVSTVNNIQLLLLQLLLTLLIAYFLLPWLLTFSLIYLNFKTVSLRYLTHAKTCSSCTCPSNLCHNIYVFSILTSPTLLTSLHPTTKQCANRLI